MEKPNPLLMGHAHNAEYVMNRKNRDSLRHLVAHISNLSLKDDIVCKLSVPSADAPGAVHEIELAVSDVIVMISMAGQNVELTSAISDIRDQVRRNSTDQASLTASLIELQEQVTKTFSPARLAQQYVADTTGLPK
jgi:hypothetical protein